VSGKNDKGRGRALKKEDETEKKRKALAAVGGALTPFQFAVTFLTLVTA
jgi:hypothetical protein